MSRVRKVLRPLIALAVLAGILYGAWLGVRDTEWWQELTAEAEVDELPSDLTEILRTATVTRTSTADSAEFVGELLYQDPVTLVHRIDPIETTVTQQVGFGRQAQTVSTTVFEPGERAITALPSAGQIIAPGEVLYETDSTPVYAAEGSVAAWRTMDADTSGEDVSQLQSYLVDGGWVDPELLEAGGEWTDATTAAVEAWQAQTDQEVTGVVALGDLWFISGPIRVTDIEATAGVIVADGTELFTYTSQTRAVEAVVEEIPEGLLEADSLSAELPGGLDASASIRSITGTATGFSILMDIDLPPETPSVNGLEVTTSWTTTELVDALTLPPEALRRLDSGVYVADVLEGDVIRTTPVEVVGQAGRVVAISGLDEQSRVLIP